MKAPHWCLEEVWKACHQSLAFGILTEMSEPQGKIPPLRKRKTKLDFMTLIQAEQISHSRGKVWNRGVRKCKALSVLMLCAPIFGSSALLGAHVVVYPCDCHYLPYSIHFSEVKPFFFPRESGQKTKILKVLVWYKNGRWQLLGVQSINTERAS